MTKAVYKTTSIQRVEPPLAIMQGPAWAFGLRGIDPAAKLLAIYVGDGVVSARHRAIDVDNAADFCGVSPASIAKLAKQLPNVTFTREGSQIRFDLGQVVK
jgi:hypothetical protein